jgi:dipeptidyl aminopeptidase/acylaminoacyl peptidase
MMTRFAGTAVTLALVGSTLAAGQPVADYKRITLEDLAAVASPSGYVLSPDGSRFAIIQGGQIALQPVAGGPSNLLTTTAGAKSELAWSPDGSILSFVSMGAIWVVEASAGEPRKLTAGGAGPGDPRTATDRNPKWNPKGRWILYESGRHGRTELNVVSEDGKASNYLVTTELYREIRNPAGKAADGVAAALFDPSPVWSPDGLRMAYAERSREHFAGKLKVLGFDLRSGRATGAPVDLYTAKTDGGGAWAIDKVAWSPDGKTLALVLQESGWDKVYLLPSTGGPPRQLTQGEYEDYTPVYSPDGTRLAVVSNRNGAEERHIWIVPVDGTSPRQLADLPLGVEANPQWSPDGSRIYFDRSGPLESQNVWVASVAAGFSPQRLTQTLPLNFSAAQFDLPERVHFTSKDGVAIAGILYRPKGYQAGARYPAVLLIHGGPEGQDTLAFSPWALFLSQEGYVVLRPNYRGSVGYGERSVI